jgi:hypothetical protein
VLERADERLRVEVSVSRVCGAHDAAAHTENLSSVNCGPRIDVLEVCCVRIEAVSPLDVVRNEGSIADVV